MEPTRTQGRNSGRRGWLWLLPVAIAGRKIGPLLEGEHRFDVSTNADHESDRVHLTNTGEAGEVGIVPNLTIRYTAPR